MALEPTTLEEAAKAFSQANDETMEATVLFFEKIALYSGGVISLSITFVGYVLSKNSGVLISKFACFPLYYIIFTAWFMLFLSLIFGIYIRLFSATHKSILMHSEWIRFYAKDRKGMLEDIKSGKAYLNDVVKADLPNWISRTENTVNEYDDLVVKSKNEVKRYYVVAPYLRGVTIGFFVTGCFLTLLFAGLSILGSI